LGFLLWIFFGKTCKKSRFGEATVYFIRESALDEKGHLPKYDKYIYLLGGVHYDIWFILLYYLHTQSGKVYQFIEEETKLTEFSNLPQIPLRN